MGVDLVVVTSFRFFKDMFFRDKGFLCLFLGCKVQGHRRTTWCCWETDCFDRKAKEIIVDSLK